ncbi:MAG: type II secretion system protein [Oscillospiraceae bacterium]|nr:type II secretion system protein [Oscillospiraceae bacterium]
MKTKNTRKGFTTVELVIVIAVIAILATVLIPTFSGMIEKANLSVDTQNVRNMNVCLATYITAGDPEDFGMVKERLKEFGYGTDDNFVAKTKNHTIRWYAEKNVILLVNDAEQKVVYPEEYKDLDITKDGTIDIRMFFDLKVPAAIVTKEASPEPVTNATAIGGTSALAVKYTFTVANEADSSNYMDWYADFYISFKNSDGTPLSTSDYGKLSNIKFAGYYPHWSMGNAKDDRDTDEEEWLAVTMDATMQGYLQSFSGEFPVVYFITGASFSYESVRDKISANGKKDPVFKCGVVDVAGDADAGIVLSVELRLTHPETDEVVVVGMYNYTFQ